MSIHNARESIASTEGANYVTLQENNTLPLDLLFLQLTGTTTTTQAATIGTRVVVVASATGAAVGRQCIIASFTQNRLTNGLITSVVGTAITIDTPFEYAIGSGDNVVFGSVDLNVNGSVTPSTFSVPNLGAAFQSPDVVITRIMIQITTTSAVGFGDFGDISGGLTNGIVLRKNNDIISNIWNVKKNSDFALLAYDYTPYDTTNPGIGIYGIAIRYTFGSMDKHGTSVKLAVGESLELIIQDNLSTLLSFRVMAQGHLEPLR